MSWKQRVKTFQERRAVKHEIEEFGEIAFYPNRISQLQQLRGLSQTVMNCMGTLFSDNRGDADQVVETGTDEDGFTVQKTSVQAVSTDVLAYRAKQQREAIEELFSLADRRNLMLLGEMLMDSMRDEFPYARQRGPQEIEEFLFGSKDEETGEVEGGIDMVLFVAMMQGWIKANSKVFGDVGEKLVGLVKGRLQAASGSEEGPTTTSGPSSKTESSQPSPTDGASNESKN